MGNSRRSRPTNREEQLLRVKAGGSSVRAAVSSTWNSASHAPTSAASSRASLKGSCAVTAPSLGSPTSIGEWASPRG